jgi:microcystin-dependent protein
MNQFIGQITLFACNFAPVGWAMCQGQVLPISQYAALFSLLGTYYGGNGTSNFALPNLQSRLPVGQGQGPGLSPYSIGEIDGVEQVSLTTSTIPPHNHAFVAYTGEATSKSPTGALPAQGLHSGGHGAGTTMNLYNTASPNVPLSTQQVTPVSGGGTPHTNLQPSLALNWCIALTGVFPARS